MKRTNYKRVERDTRINRKFPLFVKMLNEVVEALKAFEIGLTTQSNP